ncbi:MAG: SDR family NAD(P)-dependent oxidoreductase, partial [Solirubrobacteraceae bacterium]|nr:SDR family NAD(P)-dependent oxidoreductase [Solirubrobacteraceae bacterium]
GKVALVTGGSRGIGAATCRALAANGVRVGVVARRPDAIDALVAELRALGVEAVGVSADCTELASVERAAERVTDALGPVDILLPFAGGFGAFTPIAETSETEWRQVIDANLTATFLAVRVVVPAMIERERGVIVTMSSNGGRHLDKLLTASYAAAKAGIVQFTRHIAKELGPHGIRANAIAPATVTSERIDRIMDDEGRARTAALSPLGRLGTPEDCALATLFLVSNASSWVTGVTLDVAGGRVML